MNIIGIDYQQTISVLALREGRGDSAVTTSIGDGRRILVPHAVTQTGAWGSDALRDAETTCYQPLDPLRDGPWLDSPAAGLFWQGLYARLVGYLGRVKPTFANGYQMVIALQGCDWNAARNGVQSLCAQAGAGKNDPAGLREAVCIPATEALLCRWLAAASDFAPVPSSDADSDWGAARRKESDELSEEAVIAVVALGDSSTLVGAYRVQRAHTGHWRIAARPDALQHLATGLSVWQTHLINEVCSRFSEECGSGNALALRDSALDFAWQITQAADQELIWRGAGQERMYTPLRLTHAECAGWPETHLLQTSLPQALSRAVNALGKAKRPDRILVGGVGAIWPFAGEIADRVAPAWSSSNPQTDIAFGAAAWTDVSGDILHLSVSETRIETITADAPAKRSDPQSAKRSDPQSAKRSDPQSVPVRLQTQASPPPVSPPTQEQQSGIVTPASSLQTILSHRVVLQDPLHPADQEKGADNPPPAVHRAPVDGDEWNAPEPGMIPPWERE